MKVKITAMVETEVEIDEADWSNEGGGPMSKEDIIEQIRADANTNYVETMTELGAESDDLSVSDVKVIEVPST